MKVAYFTRPCYFDTTLPLVEQLALLAEVHLFVELTPQGWRTNVLEGDLSASASPGLVSGGEAAEHYLGPLRERLGSVQSVTLAVHTAKRSLAPRSLGLGYRTVRAMSRQRPDIVHIEEGSPRIALSAGGFGSIPVLMSIHDALHHSGESNWRVPFMRRLMFPHVESFILHNRSDVQGFRSAYRVPESRVVVIPFGIDSAMALGSSAADPDDGKTVLMFGRLSPYKGLETMFQAAPEVARAVPGLRLVVAGRPIPGYEVPPPPALSNGGICEVRAEYVSNTEMSELFQSSTVVALPYTDATQSGVVLTAYAFGRPVVVTDVGGLAEYVEDRATGIVVAPQDPTGLARALVEILSDESWRERARLRIAERSATALSWSEAARQTLQSYEAVVRRRRRKTG